MEPVYGSAGFKWSQPSVRLKTQWKTGKFNTAKQKLGIVYRGITGGYFQKLFTPKCKLSDLVSKHLFISPIYLFFLF